VTTIAFVDGEQVEWPGPATIDDPTTRPGAGLFETMRARRGEMPLASRHVARLTASAKALGLSCPPAATIRAFLERATAATEIGDHRVRLMLNETGRVVVQVSPFEASAVPIRLATVAGPVQVEGFAEHKTSAYLPYIRAREQATSSGADHALLVRADGTVLEADHGSVVALVDGDLVTPDAQDILPGVARALLIERLGIGQRRLSVANLVEADSVFVVNALRGVTAIATVDGQALRSVNAELERIACELPELHSID
jgi:para-aminobenzoate synthetase / 4-amino-4-deoxychorismate lyase